MLIEVLTGVAPLPRVVRVLVNIARHSNFKCYITVINELDLR